MENSNDCSRNAILYEKCPVILVENNKVPEIINCHNNNNNNDQVSVALELNAEQSLLTNCKNCSNDLEKQKFIRNLQEKKRQWKVPWFLLIMGFLEISLYFIANRCLRNHLMFSPDHSTEYWRYVTYMLLHSDILHLTMNVLLQLLIGFYLESEQGHFKVLCIYIAGGISGSLATLYMQPQLSLMGASAGVYAMLMSHIPHLVKNFYNLSHRYWRILALNILFISDVCFTLFHVIIHRNTNPRICLEAHISGAVTGFLMGFLLYRRLEKMPSSIQIQWKCLMPVER